jgi:hypothetical protein
MDIPSHAAKWESIISLRTKLIDNRVYVELLNKSDSSLYLIHEGQKIYRFDLSDILYEEKLNPRRLNILLRDTSGGYLFSKDSFSNFYQFSNQGFKKIYFKDKEGDSGYNLIDIPSSPFLKDGNLMLAAKAYMKSLNDSENRNEYFSSSSIALLNLESGSISSFGNFPMNYRSGHQETIDYYAQIAWNSVDSICSVGFKYSSDLENYEISGSKIRLINTENLKIPEPFDEQPPGIIHDQIIKRTYENRSPAFLGLKYNQTNKSYYRPFKESIRLEGSGVPINPKETSWLMLIYDSEFDLDEIIDMGETSYYPYSLEFNETFIFLTKWGDNDGGNLRIQVDKIRSKK